MREEATPSFVEDAQSKPDPDADALEAKMMEIQPDATLSEISQQTESDGSETVSAPEENKGDINIDLSSSDEAEHSHQETFAERVQRADAEDIVVDRDDEIDMADLPPQARQDVAMAQRMGFGRQPKEDKDETVQKSRWRKGQSFNLSTLFGRAKSKVQRKPGAGSTSESAGVNQILLTAVLSTALTILIIHFIVLAPLKERILYLEEDITYRPPVTILDLESFAENIPDDEGKELNLEKHLAKLKAHVQLLSDQGWLVLDGGAVAGAPDDVYYTFTAKPTEE